jgi:hypothetical protein
MIRQEERRSLYPYICFLNWEYIICEVLCRTAVEQRPSWEVDSASVSKEIPPHILGNPEFHYRAHRSLT